MSGLSLLYTAHFERDGEKISRRFVTRAMPHPDDMHFHLVYAATRTATVMARIGRRSIMLGDREAPENADELVLNAGVLRGLLDGNREF